MNPSSTTAPSAGNTALSTAPPFPGNLIASASAPIAGSLTSGTASLPATNPALDTASSPDNYTVMEDSEADTRAPFEHLVISPGIHVSIFYEGLLVRESCLPLSCSSCLDAHCTAPSRLPTMVQAVALHIRPCKLGRAHPQNFGWTFSLTYGKANNQNLQLEIRQALSKRSPTSPPFRRRRPSCSNIGRRCVESGRLG